MVPICSPQVPRASDLSGATSLTGCVKIATPCCPTAPQKDCYQSGAACSLHPPAQSLSFSAGRAKRKEPAGLVLGNNYPPLGMREAGSSSRQLRHTLPSPAPPALSILSSPRAPPDISSMAPWSRGLQASCTTASYPASLQQCLGPLLQKLSLPVFLSLESGSIWPQVLLGAEDCG